MCCRISTLTISRLTILIALVQVSHSCIIRRGLWQTMGKTREFINTSYKWGKTVRSWYKLGLNLLIAQWSLCIRRNTGGKISVNLVFILGEGIGEPRLYPGGMYRWTSPLSQFWIIIHSVYLAFISVLNHHTLGIPRLYPSFESSYTRYTSPLSQFWIIIHSVYLAFIPVLNHHTLGIPRLYLSFESSYTRYTSPLSQFWIIIHSVNLVFISVLNHHTLGKPRLYLSFESSYTR